jgi:tetratricopeptide (TPR) repeat protein
MERISFSQRQGIILLIGFVIVAIVAVILYRVFRIAPPPEDGISTNAITTLPSVAILASSTTSPISPVSLISPVSPLTQVPPDPTILETVAQQGIALYNNQDYIGAIKIFNDVLVQDPRNFLAYNARGTAYLELKEYDKAIGDYSKAIELQPFFPDAYYNLGRVYRLLKKYDEAIANLKKSIKLSPPEFGYRANGNIGLIYHQQREYAKALEAFATAISYDDSKADTYYLRGETYTAMENYEAAISDYQAALSRFPNYNQAYQGLGYAFYKTAQFDQARTALNKAVEISSNSPTTHFYLMLVYLATDQLDQARAEVSQAMDGIGALSEEEQNLLFKRVLADLETFNQENPAKARDVEALVKLIPEPQQP